MNAFIFTVDGAPVGKGRPRMTKYGTAYTPQKTRVYERQVRQSFRDSGGEMLGFMGLPVAVDIVAVFEPPKSVSKKKRAAMIAGDITPTKKPDADNIIKIICDALNGYAYHDDAQVTRVSCQKVYGEQAHVTVTIIA